MFKTQHLDFRKAGTLNALVLDYVEKNPAIAPFYNHFPDAQGFAALLAAGPYANFDREQLYTILLQQSKQVENTPERTLKHLELLKQPDTFTVTTGHQLCLFTGPLYFIYKLFSAIELAKELHKKFPDQHFVPVYWMASEDHDFEEVASFHVNGKTLTWKSEQKGAVGHFKTQELKALLPELKEALGHSENSNYLLDLFEQAYLKHDTLAKATRYLVNALFESHGLICIDGDDAAFKKQFSAFLKTDLFEHRPEALVSQEIGRLEALGYPVQVKPRPINCFYLDTQMRTRIEQTDDAFELVGTGRSLSAKELEDIVNTQPERISPNVVLRPVYQQVILPNLAYVGGPGELAYWLEFRQLFHELNVVLPVLMPRNFFTVIDKQTQRSLGKLKLSEADVFKPEQELVKTYLGTIQAVTDLGAETQALTDFYDQLSEKIKTVDPTLQRHVLAAGKKALNQLETVGSKTNKAWRRKEATAIQQIHTLKQQLFPNGMPQERYENFASFYLHYGPAFFKAIESRTEPFALDHKILVED